MAEGSCLYSRIKLYLLDELTGVFPWLTWKMTSKYRGKKALWPLDHLFCKQTLVNNLVGIMKHNITRWPFLILLAFVFQSVYAKSERIALVIGNFDYIGDD